MIDPGYVGQEDRLVALEATVEAHRRRGRTLPHMLFLGGAGRGKTRLAQAVATATGKPLVTLYAPSVEDRDQIAAKLIEADGGILFIDEIHSLPRTLAEDLYTVLDENMVNVLVPQTRVITKPKYLVLKNQLPVSMRNTWHGLGFYDIPETIESGVSHVEQHFLTHGITVIGATTDEALLTPAFLSRLSSLKVYLREYTLVELATIGILYAEDHGYTLEPEAATYLALRSRGTPRRMLQLLERSIDFTTEGTVVYSTATQTACMALGVDDNGLEEPHRAILRALLDAGATGLSRTSLGQRLGLTPKNLMLYWGELIEKGLVKVGTRHEITEKGRDAISQ